MIGYGYAVDLAENLNYCAITVLEISRYADLVDIRKFKNVRYPQIRSLLMDDMFPRMPPLYIATDYTSEKSFSEELEAKMNSSFMVQGSSYYNKFKYVEPYVFTAEFKMLMKQNARSMMENKIFRSPAGFSSPEKKALWDELEQQIFREITEPKLGGGFKVPKPPGQDNDLVMSLEMNLYKAREYLGSYGNESQPFVYSWDVTQDQPLNQKSDKERYREKLKEITNNISTLGTTRTVKVKLPGESDFS